MKLKKGFTLIEVLFIVAIFAVFATLMVSSYQQQTIKQKIEKTALQMQEILQAAAAYYNDNGNWPASSIPPVNFSNYLPVGLTKNPWGAPFIYQFNNSQFTVNSGTLPSSNLALRLQSLLPNATINPNNPLQVLVSPFAQQASTIAIQAIGLTGVLSDGGSMPQPFQVSCPSGTTPYNLAMPRDYFSSNQDVCYGDISRPFGLLYAPISCTPDNQQANTYNCNVVVSFNGVLPDKKLPYNCKKSSDEIRGAGFLQLSYITWCQ